MSSSPTSLPTSLVAATRALPPLPRAGSAPDLNPAQRRVMVAGILAAHVAAGWGLLQVSAVREALLQAAPMFVEPHHAAGTARAARNATAAAATGRQALAFA